MPRPCSGDSSAGVAVIFSGQACECCEGFLFKRWESSQTPELQFHAHLMGFTPQSRPFASGCSRKSNVALCLLRSALPSFLAAVDKQPFSFPKTVYTVGLFPSSLVAKCGIARANIPDGSGWWGSATGQQMTFLSSHPSCLTGRSYIYKQSRVFGDGKELHMDGGRSGALLRRWDVHQVYLLGGTFGDIQRSLLRKGPGFQTAV